MDKNEDFDRTIEIGERAFGYLKQFHTPAIPRNYELFYAYSTGLYEDLCTAIGNLIALGKEISSAEAERLFNKFLSPNQLGRKIEGVGKELTDEIDELLATLDGGVLSTDNFEENLLSTRDKLTGKIEPELLVHAVQRLIKDTEKMVAETGRLRGELKDSRKHVELLRHHLEFVRAETFRDLTTGIANRECFDWTLESAIAQAKEARQPLCLLMCDVDAFKAFNDSYGHQIGDAVLRLVAQTINANIKGRDLVARYGGEEFAVILTDTALKTAMLVAEQIREAVFSKELVKKSSGQRLGHVTISIGVAEHQEGESEESLIDRADQCLYAAKRAGRNCIRNQPEEPETNSKPAAPQTREQGAG